MESGPGRGASERAGLLRVYMLGGFRLLRGADDLHPERWELQKAAAVFKYLVHEDGRWVPTDVLLELFWPDTDPDRARSALRTTVYTLRRTLEPELERYGRSSFVEASRGRYRFRAESPHWWDVKAFQQLIASGRQAWSQGQTDVAAELLEQALDLYGGDFLPEDRYEEWTALPRERLRHVYLEAVLELAALLRSRPDGIQRALGRLREAVSRAPEREDLQREFIWHLAASGNVPEALRQYEALRRMLDAEFGVEPAPETQALVRRIKQGEPLGGPAAAVPPPVAAAGGPDAASAQARWERSRLATGPGPVVPSPGAMVADWPTFRRIVQLERRRMLRWYVPAAVLFIQLGSPAVDPGPSWDQAEAFFERRIGGAAPGEAAEWQQRAATHLRQGDVVCPLGDRWLLVLLPHGDEEAARMVARRLALLAGDGPAGGLAAPATFQFQVLPLRPAR